MGLSQLFSSDMYFEADFEFFSFLFFFWWRWWWCMVEVNFEQVSVYVLGFLKMKHCPQLVAKHELGSNLMKEIKFMCGELLCSLFRSIDGICCF